MAELRETSYCRPRSQAEYLRVGPTAGVKGPVCAKGASLGAPFDNVRPCRQKHPERPAVEAVAVPGVAWAWRDRGGAQRPGIASNPCPEAPRRPSFHKAAAGSGTTSRNQVRQPEAGRATGAGSGTASTSRHRHRQVGSNKAVAAGSGMATRSNRRPHLVSPRHLTGRGTGAEGTANAGLCRLRR